MPASLIILFAVHIAAGTIALTSGPFAMFSHKGRTLHRRAGLVYVAAMLVVVTTAVPISLYRWNPFLLSIAVFSFFLTFSGYRAVKRPRFPKGMNASSIDWVAALISAAFAAAILVYGIILANLLSMIFGTLGLVLTSAEMWKYRHNSPNRPWLINHLIGMLAAYIATFTAFSVTNLRFLPPLVRWLGPTVIGTISITIVAQRYAKPRVSKPSVKLSPRSAA